MSESEVQVTPEAAHEAPGHESPETTTDSPPATEQSAGTDESTSESPPPRRRRSGGGFQRQISALTRELAEVRGHLAEREHAATPAQEQRPNRDEFEDYEAYLRADAAHEAREAVRSEMLQFEEQQQQRQLADQAARSELEYTTRLNAAYDKYEDFEEVAFGLMITDAMGQAIYHSEVGPDMAYFLGLPENSARAQQIAAMTPQQQMLAMGRLEGELQAKSKPRTLPRSAAPPPPTDVGGSTVSNSNDLHDGLSMKEWQRRRAAQVKAQRGY